MPQAKVNISAKFTKDTDLYNGLDASELLADPSAIRTAVVTYRVKFGKTDYENGGAETPTVRIVEFEPLTGEAAVDAKTLQREAFKARTGNAMQEEDLFSGHDDDEDEGDHDEGDED